jgi:hypothetical protein
MIDRKTITLPATMPLHKRISEAARQIREWVRSYESGPDHCRYQLRLVHFEEDNGLNRFRYEFLSKDTPSLPEEHAPNNEAEG